jgi:hypothetical protein
VSFASVVGVVLNFILGHVVTSYVLDVLGCCYFVFIDLNLRHLGNSAM